MGEDEMNARERLQYEIREVDGMGRLCLGEGRTGEEYLVNEHPDGTIVLKPMASVHEHEAWLYRNPEAKELVLRGLADSAAGRAHSLGSFAQYADEPDDE